MNSCFCGHGPSAVMLNRLIKACPSGFPRFCRRTQCISRSWLARCHRPGRAPSKRCLIRWSAAIGLSTVALSNVGVTIPIPQDPGSSSPPSAPPPPGDHGRPSPAREQQNKKKERLEKNISAPSKEDPNNTNSLSSWHGLDFLSSSLPINNNIISDILSSWPWSPSLPFIGIQERISALFLELGLGPGSLYSEIIKENPDVLLHPECEWDAQVRLGDELCLSEQAFLKERKRKMRKPFAEFIGVPLHQVHEDDVPIVAVAGSGGGYRAMLNTIGSLSACESAGLLSCITYTAGISGSCWALGTIYSGIAGSTQPVDAGQHVKNRINLSYLDMATLEALITPPTNKYLLTGLLRKAAGEFGSVSLVDLYGTFVSSRIFVPSDLDKIDIRQMSLHRFREKIDDGSLPLPIFTALQHVLPYDNKVEDMKDTESSALHSSKRMVLEPLNTPTPSRWLWYEFTPYEVGCDELGAWIPPWALGRPFMNGKNLDRRPEMSFMILSGIFASAFCASLKHYFAEIRPTLRLLPTQLYQWLEDIITENERDLGLIHPVLPSEVPNFMKGLTGLLRPNSPEDVTTNDTLGFLDAGAELNIPYYPLIRRNVDCVIAFDASADSQDLWFKRAEELAVKRGLRTWPRGARWPTRLIASTASSTEGVKETVATDPETANIALAKQQESEVLQQELKVAERANMDIRPKDNSLSTNGSCEVWIGTTKTDETESSSRLDDLEEEQLSRRDGIGIVYIPLVPNSAVPGFDPSSISTWRREVLPDESQNLLDTAQANLNDGVPKIKRLLIAMWKRKRAERLKKSIDTLAASEAQFASLG